MSTNQIINDVLPWTQVTASASQTVFDTNWTSAYPENIIVYKRAAAATPDELTQVLSTSAYVVTFVGTAQVVRVTLLSGATAGDIVTIIRDTPADRLNLYTNTNFVPSMLNQDTAILTLVDQERQMLNDLSVKYHVSGMNPNFAATQNLPVVPLTGNQVWATNPTGTAIIGYDVPEGGGLAPSAAKYLVQTADVEVPNAQAMGELSTGIVVNTAGTGVQLTRTLTGTANEVSVTDGTGLSGNPTVSLPTDLILPGTMEAGGAIDMAGFGVNNALDPVLDQDLATKIYVDTSVGSAAGGITGNMQYNNGGAFAGDADINTDGAGNLEIDGSLEVDNININGNTISSTDTNGNINLTPNGTGQVLVPTPTASTAATTKQYVDSLVAGLNFLNPAYAATTADLSGYTYDNGVSGVGATLTAGSNGAFATDSVSPALGARILVKNQTATEQNGVYTLSTVGDGSNLAVLTRATDYNTPAQITSGDYIIVEAGSTQSNTSWVQTATVTLVGTDPITFTQFTASIPVNVASGGTGRTSDTAYALIAGGTTSTSAHQSLGTGTSGQLLQSKGNAALPDYTTATYPTTTTANRLLYSSSTNEVGELATGTGVNTALGQNVTGSGGMALQTSPTFITPILGVAAATSISLGAAALNAYDVGTFNSITFTAAIHGDLSVTYPTRITSFQVFGSACYFSILLQITPTFSTASGDVSLSGMPVIAAGTLSCFSVSIGGAGFTNVANTISIYGQVGVGSSSMAFRSNKSGAAASPIGITSFTSGQVVTLVCSGRYSI